MIGGEPAVALALHDTVDHPVARIKWPNDLYLGDKKAGGILIQNSVGGMFLQSSVVGIGLNVNQLEFDPALPNPTSLAAAAGHAFDPELTMHQLFACLERRYLQLKAGRLTEIKTAYENVLFRRNVRSGFVKTAGDAPFEGVIRSIADSGHLNVEMPGGELKAFDLKEIRMIV